MCISCSWDLVVHTCCSARSALPMLGAQVQVSSASGSGLSGLTGPAPSRGSGTVDVSPWVRAESVGWVAPGACPRLAWRDLEGMACHNTLPLYRQMLADLGKHSGVAFCAFHDAPCRKCLTTS